MFVILLSIQPLFRLRPIAKSEEILPRVAAVIAVSLPLMYMLLDRAPPNLTFNLIAVVLSVLANVMALVTVSFLGRSLSVMPEARRLVQRGPYGQVRHPLYLFEMLATAAVALQYRSLLAVGLLLLAVVLQVARARWEEDVLARVLPDFAAYRAQTPFLIPRDPAHFLASFMMDSVVRRRAALVVVSMVAVLALVATVLPRLIA
jgi:protein-S-isoprenylcysteine O-methyltransferase Ste14